MNDPFRAKPVEKFGQEFCLELGLGFEVSIVRILCLYQIIACLIVKVYQDAGNSGLLEFVPMLRVEGAAAAPDVAFRVSVLHSVQGLYQMFEVLDCNRFQAD